MDRSDNGLLDHLLGQEAHLHQGRLHFSHGQGKNDIPVIEGMDRDDDPDQAVLGQLSQLAGLGLVEAGVGQDHPQGGVLNQELLGLDSAFHAGPGVGEGPVIRPGAGPGDDVACKVPHVPEGVDHHQSGNDQALLSPDGAVAQSPFGGLQHTKELADGGPGPGADAAFGRVIGGSVQAGLVAQGLVRAHGGVAEAEVEEDGRGHNGHPGDRHVETDSPFFQVL